MRTDILLLASDLAKRGEPFALATVVRREPPSSAQLGDTALVTAGGAFHGWLGGSCTQPAVVREAIDAMAQGEPRLISLAPEPERHSRPGVTVYPMTCHSGGCVDIYVEPVLPAPRLLIFGVSPVAQALARLATVLGYKVEAVDPAADRATFPEADRVVTDLDDRELRHRSRRDPAGLVAVVATLGEQDEAALLTALALEPAYLGVVASRKRFAQLREAMIARGIAPESLDRISSPAGLDLGAATPQEIALSILAEIIQVGRAPGGQRGSTAMDESSPHQQADPVCGMAVVVATARHTASFAGRTYYFCGAGCRERFLAAPERYAVAAGAGGTA